MKTVHIGIATAADVKARAKAGPQGRAAGVAHRLCLAGFDVPGVDASPAS
jgi:hypothetical protein